MDCEQLNSTVSWQGSDLAVGYVAYFENQNGHCVSCVAGDTDVSCNVSELMCGTVYRVRVKALGQQYNSSDSTAFSLTSGKHQLCEENPSLIHSLNVNLCFYLLTVII